MDLLDQLAAEREIRALTAAYAQHADDRDADAYAGLFTDDGVFDIGARRLEGRPAIHEFMAGGGDGVKRQHAMFNLLVSLDGDRTATGTIDAMVSAKDGDGWRPALAVRYHDRYTKTADGWRFAERVLAYR
jgi:uncharacterized protein (TIGR02246 family)